MLTPLMDFDATCCHAAAFQIRYAMLRYLRRFRYAIMI